MTKFEVYQDAGDEFRFRLKAANGQNILASEGYSARSNCLNGIESVRKNSQDDTKFERKISAGGKHFFNLLAGNGQVIGTSQLYDGTSGMENGIESVKKNAPEAVVEEVKIIVRT